MADMVTDIQSRKSREILIFKNIDKLSDYAVEKWKEISKTAVNNRGFFKVAVSGGTTPVTLYKKLSALKNSLLWDKTHIFLVDERFVSHNDSESNYRQLNQTLLRHIKIPGKNIHPVITSEETPQISAVKYEKDLISCFRLEQNQLPKFDLILLGIGEDGHTASLFPDSPALKESSRLTAAVLQTDITIKKRISLTFPVINNADNIIFLIRGFNKAGVLKEIIEKENRILPAAMVRPKKGRLFFLIDKDAGSLLSGMF
jgi:6-phosphogluconolactonase